MRRLVAETRLSVDDLVAPLFIREAWNPDGIVQVALRDLRDEVGDDMVLMADLCVDEYTDHGHCGVLDGNGSVDNDATLELYVRAAVAQADAGAAVTAVSQGQV